MTKPMTASIDTPSSAETLQALLGQQSLSDVRTWCGLEHGTSCQVWRLELLHHTSVIFKYRPQAPVDFFSSEIASLDFLAKRGFAVPAVIAHNQRGLLLEDAGLDLSDAAAPDNIRNQLALNLARLHQITAPQFGFMQANYLGICRLKNKWQADWPQFFWDNYLAPHMQHQAFDASDRRRWLKLQQQLPDLLAHRPTPRLCHGDAWSHNFLWKKMQLKRPAQGAKDYQMVFIDSAACFSDYALEWVYMRYFNLLDGPAEAIYQQHLALPEALHELTPLYELHLLLVHLQQCGRGYLQSIRQRLQYYVA